VRGTCWIVVGLPSPLIWKTQRQAGVSALTVKSTLALNGDSTCPCCEWACWLTRSVPDASLMAIRNVASKALILPLTVSGLVTRVRQFIGDLKGEIDEAELGKRRSVGSKSEIA